jgi:hypothetical protein
VNANLTHSDRQQNVAQHGIEEHRHDWMLRDPAHRQFHSPLQWGAPALRPSVSASALLALLARNVVVSRIDSQAIDYGPRSQT